MNHLSEYLVDELLKEVQGVEDYVVIYAGRFQPFHKGHFSTYTHLVKKFGKSNVFIGTSDKTDQLTSPFNFKEKKLIMTKLFGVPSNRVVQIKNPYSPVEILKNFDKNKTAYIAAIGEKDKNRLGGKYFKPYDSNLEVGYGDGGYVYVSPSETKPISGNQLRNIIRNTDYNESINALQKIYPKFDKSIFDLIISKVKELDERIFISKDIIEEFIKQNFVQILNEVTTSTAGPAQNQGKMVDDGPNFFFPNYDVFDEVSKERAEEIGYSVLKQIMSKDLEDYYEHPIYPKGPVKAVTPFTAGVVGATTATNQKDFNDIRAYSLWLRHIKRVVGAVGWDLVKNEQNLEIQILSQRGLASLRKQGRKENKASLKEGVIKEDTIKLFKKSLGVNRNDMPQIKSKDISEYLKFLKDKGIQVKTTSIPVSKIGMTQKNVNLDKVKGLMGGDIKQLSKPVILSKDNYVMDGHHRVVALYNIDPNFKIKGIKVDVPIKELLELTSDFPRVSYKGIEEYANLFIGHIKPPAPNKGLGMSGEEDQDYQVVDEEIKLDVNIGDTILTGRFKNKRTVVKSIGKDEHGMPTINGRKVVNFRTLKEGLFVELSKPINEIPMSDLRAIDNYADRQLNPYDVVLTDRHFFDRLQDPRNVKPITSAELIGFFKRLRRNKDELIYFLDKYKTAVAKDKRTKINIPFMKLANKVIAKTIMRKDDFKTSSPEVTFELYSNPICPRKPNESDEEYKLRCSPLIGPSVLMNLPSIGEDIDEKDYGKKPYVVDLEDLTKDNPNFRTTKWTGDDLQMTLMSVDDEIGLEKHEDGDQFIRVEDGVGKVVMGLDKDDLEFEADIEDDYAIFIPQGYYHNIINTGDTPLKVYAIYSPVEHPKGRVDKTKPIEELMIGYPDEKWMKKHAKRLKRIRKDLNKQHKDVYGEGVLNEGGAYGHINHPFDVKMNLSFGQLKDIVKKALNGDLELTREKTDGMALAVSWKDGRLIAARNKSHLKNQGENALDINGIVQKFEGRGEVADAYNYAMKDLSVAISHLSNKEELFKNGKVFANLEVIYPSSTNVIPYGQSLLVFHGTMEYDEKGNPISEDSKMGRTIATLIKDINHHVQSKYTLQGPPVTELPKSKDLVSLQPKYLGMIDKLQKEYKLGDTDGISEYHQSWWSEYIDKNQKDIDEQIKIGLIKRWAFNDKSYRLSNIKDQELKSWADKVEKQDHKKITKQNLMKFEKIFLGVGAEVLSFMSSVLTVHHDKAKRQIVSQLKKTIRDIKASGDSSKIQKLELELKRLQDIGGFDKIVPNEGIVFVYGGKTLKLTGAFSSINQILGIMKFSR